MKMRLRDWLVVVLGLILAVRTGGNVYRLYKTGERVKEAEVLVAEAQADNVQLEQRLEEVQSPEFVEKEAKERLGLGREGEQIVLIPQENQGWGDKRSGGVGGGEANWRKWWDLYIRI